MYSLSKRRFREILFRETFKFRDVAIPLAIGILCFLVNFSVLRFLFSNFPWIIGLFFGRGSWWIYQPLSVKVVYVIGVAPIVEEVIHRRLVLQFFLNRDMVFTGLIISSLTFGLHHILFGWGILKAVDVFFIGMVFGAVYLRYRLFGSWLTHFSNNLMSVIFTLLRV